MNNKTIFTTLGTTNIITIDAAELRNKTNISTPNSTAFDIVMKPIAVQNDAEQEKKENYEQKVRPNHCIQRLSNNKSGKTETHFNIDTYYRWNQTAKLFLSYFQTIVRFARDFEKISPPAPNILSQHNITRKIRTKMIDWFIEVFYAYNSDNQTWFTCFHIFDSYLSKCQSKLTDKNVHLIGVVCIFIASKLEDIYPIRLSQIINKISYGKFSKVLITSTEIEIWNCLNFEVYTTTVNDYIKSYIFDLYLSNKEHIENMKWKNYLECIENNALFLGKMCYWDDELSAFENSTKVCCCIIFSCDLVIGNTVEISKEFVDFINKWNEWLLRGLNNSDFWVVNGKISELYKIISGYKFELTLKRVHQIYFCSG